ncbi:MAG: universal stress protein [Burkholderiales bacterium]
MYKHLLAAVDGSELSLESGRRAIELAKVFKARLSAVMACPSFQQLKDKGYLPPALDAMRGEWEHDVAGHARTILSRFAAEAENAGVICGTVLVVDDHPYRTIINTARENNCDLIVMGSHGYGGFRQLLLGSQTTQVLAHSKIPVLVYR